MRIATGLGQYSAIIQVKACSDASVILAPDIGNWTHYVEVIIGGWKNEQTVIIVKEDTHETIEVRVCE